MQSLRSFSLHNRDTVLNLISGQTFDVLIIGGGITGAGIALDMASRGLRVCLVEKNDFASGTSSRSTKLIHGGLRYLKQMEINLVKEVGRERAIVHANAPHLVTPEPMLLPILKRGSLSKWSTRFALMIYEWLAGVKPSEKRKILNKGGTLKQEPLLLNNIVKGGVLYTEYRTDDARLVIELLKTANAYGALCVNYVEVSEFTYDQKKISGAQVLDSLHNQAFTIHAKHVVNATGPWVDTLREKDGSLHGKRLHHTKGVHLVVAYDRMPIKQAAYFDSPDGRMIFAIPRMGNTYIGTTDTNYSASLDGPVVSKEDVDYLLKAVNRIFPTVKLSTTDIRSSWAGLRPLIHQDGKSPSELSRKDEIFKSPSGLYSIAGGKLTGYRMMAKRITDLVVKEISKIKKQPVKEGFTHLINISGGNFSMTHSLDDFLNQMLTNAKLIGAEKHQVTLLVNRYGSHSNEIIKKAFENYARNPNTAQSLLQAEIEYSVKNEMTLTLNDFLIRRTGRLYFERETLEEQAPWALKMMETLLEWNSVEKEKNWVNFQNAYQQAIAFH
jgi:glycerol-3-phosphate dehydrogenase